MTVLVHDSFRPIRSAMASVPPAGLVKVMQRLSGSRVFEKTDVILAVSRPQQVHPASMYVNRSFDEFSSEPELVLSFVKPDEPDIEW